MSSIDSLTATTSDADALDRLLASRFSCRRFLPTPAPEQIIRRMLETARRPPSSNNAQPWQVIVTTGAGTERFREGFYRAAANSPWNPDFTLPNTMGHRERRRECGLMLYKSVGHRAGRQKRHAASASGELQSLRAPHAMIVHMDPKLGPPTTSLAIGWRRPAAA